MSKRDELQEQFSDKYVKGWRKGIFLISVRFGKTRLGIKIMQKLKVNKVLIAYPDGKIRDSWEKDFTDVGYKPEVIYTTFRSMHKYIDKYDMVIIDEIHRMSDNNMLTFNDLSLINENILGLTGTLSSWTKKQLYDVCDMDILDQYLIEDAIEDDIVANYEIHIIQYDIESKPFLKKTKTKQWITTEKKELIRLSKAVEKNDFLRIRRMQWINNCQSLINTTKKFLIGLEGRFILFGNTKKTVDSFGIPTHYGTSKENNLEKFIKGEINRLGLINIAREGITFPNLSIIIITNIDSNSENLLQRLGRSLLKEEDKVSKVYIIVSREEFQQKWLRKALVGIPKSKVIWT